MKISAVIIAVSLLAAGCGKPNQEKTEAPVVQKKALYGSVSFSERIGLTPDARLEIILLDVSLADAPAVEIARASFDNPGQAPIPFSIDYDPSIIDERHSYSVSARVYDREQLIFISDTVNPALTHGATDEVNVRTVRAARNTLQQPDAPLANTKWMLTSVNGISVDAVDRGDQAHLFLDGANQKVTGFGGCNRFNGTFSTVDKKISIGNVAITMMACDKGNEIELAFMDALGQIDEYRIKGGTLRGYGAGTLIVSFKANSSK